jgi:hypothetical protein
VKHRQAKEDDARQDVATARAALAEAEARVRKAERGALDASAAVRRAEAREHAAAAKLDEARGVGADRPLAGASNEADPAAADKAGVSTGGNSGS